MLMVSTKGMILMIMKGHHEIDDAIPVADLDDGDDWQLYLEP